MIIKVQVYRTIKNGHTILKANYLKRIGRKAWGLMSYDYDRLVTHIDGVGYNHQLRLFCEHRIVIFN